VLLLTSTVNGRHDGEEVTSKERFGDELGQEGGSVHHDGE